MMITHINDPSWTFILHIYLHLFPLITHFMITLAAPHTVIHAIFHGPKAPYKKDTTFKTAKRTKGLKH